MLTREQVEAVRDCHSLSCGTRGAFACVLNYDQTCNAPFGAELAAQLLATMDALTTAEARIEALEAEANDLAWNIAANWDTAPTWVLHEDSYKRVQERAAAILRGERA